MRLISNIALGVLSALNVSAFAPISNLGAIPLSFGNTSVKTTSFGAPNISKHAVFDKPREAFSKLFMGWGPEPVWEPAIVKSTGSSSASGNFVTVVVQAPFELIESYKVPGQYVQLKQDISDEKGKPIFLAIASPPVTDEDGNENIEFLIKKADSNDWITSAEEGLAIAISQVLGSGFPIEEECEGLKYDFPLQNYLLFANGSGIAPIRAAIESGQLKIAKPGQGGRTARLYFGCTTPADMPYISKFKEWEMNGVQVVPVISKPEECGTEWTGRSGYVQNCLEEDGIAIPRNTAALLCGVKGMTESIKDLLTKSGVFEGRVMTNF